MKRFPFACDPTDLRPLLADSRLPVSNLYIATEW